MKQKGQRRQVRQPKTMAEALVKLERAYIQGSDHPFYRIAYPFAQQIASQVEPNEEMGHDQFCIAAMKAITANEKTHLAEQQLEIYEGHGDVPAIFERMQTRYTDHVPRVATLLFGPRFGGRVGKMYQSVMQTEQFPHGNNYRPF